jgi:hypothetical protein
MHRKHKKRRKCGRSCFDLKALYCTACLLQYMQNIQPIQFRIIWLFPDLTFSRQHLHNIRTHTYCLLLFKETFRYNIFCTTFLLYICRKRYIGIQGKQGKDAFGHWKKWKNVQLHNCSLCVKSTYFPLYSLAKNTFSLLSLFSLFSEFSAMVRWPGVYLKRNRLDCVYEFKANHPVIAVVWNTSVFQRLDTTRR